MYTMAADYRRGDVEEGREEERWRRICLVVQKSRQFGLVSKVSRFARDWSDDVGGVGTQSPWSAMGHREFDIEMPSLTGVNQSALIGNCIHR